MKLTEAKLKELIIEAVNSKLAILKLAKGDVVLEIPAGFFKRKDGDDKLNPGHHQIVIVTRDRMKKMDISYEYNVEDISMNIFVRDPDENTSPRLLDHRGSEYMPAGTPPELIQQKFNELMKKLEEEK